MACADAVDPRVRFPHGRAQEILLEELQVEVGYHVQVRRVEVQVKRLARERLDLLGRPVRGGRAANRARSARGLLAPRREHRGDAVAGASRATEHCNCECFQSHVANASRCESVSSCGESL